MGLCSLPLESFSYDHGLPMASAVAATAAVEAATTTVEAATAANRAAVESTTDCYVRSAAAETAHCAVSDVAVSVPAVTTAPAVSAAVSRTSVEATVEPRASTDEDATGEVAGTVVTIGRAGIRVIPIVSVGADRSRADIARTDADADCETLSISVRRQSQRGSKHCKDHEILHKVFHI
jgi:hypothetical protein